jgi:hypothetical protein
MRHEFERAKRGYSGAPPIALTLEPRMGDMLERMLNAAAKRLASYATRLESLCQQKAHTRASQQNASNPNALFIWIPKTAGTSLNNLLREAGGQKLKWEAEARSYFRNRGIVTFGHMSVPHLREAGIISDDFYDSAVKFAFVRNPFDRAVSLYEFLRSIEVLPPSMGFSTYCTMLREREFEDIGAYNRLGLSPINPQLAWLTDRNGEPCVDFIGRYEQLDRDVRALIGLLKIDVPNKAVAHANKSVRKPIEEYYGPAEVEAIQTAYRCDFESFGYSVTPGWQRLRIAA